MYPVSMAVDIVHTWPVTVVAEDADTIALLIHLVHPGVTKVFIVSVSKALCKLVSIQKCRSM